MVVGAEEYLAFRYRQGGDCLLADLIARKHFKGRLRSQHHGLSLLACGIETAVCREETAPGGAGGALLPERLARLQFDALRNAVLVDHIDILAQDDARPDALRRSLL